MLIIFPTHKKHRSYTAAFSFRVEVFWGSRDKTRYRWHSHFSNDDYFPNWPVLKHLVTLILEAVATRSMVSCIGGNRCRVQRYLCNFWYGTWGISRQCKAPLWRGLLIWNWGYTFQRFRIIYQPHRSVSSDILVPVTIVYRCSPFWMLGFAHFGIRDAMGLNPPHSDNCRDAWPAASLSSLCI